MRKINGLILMALLAALLCAQAATAEPTRPAPPKCANESCQDPLFTVDYPASGSFTTSHDVEVPTPVQFYDAKVFNAYGTADLGYLRKLTAGTGFQPLETDDGHGIVNFDVNEWLDTNIEPYNEVVLNIPVNRDRVVVNSSSNPYELLGSAIDPKNELYVVAMVLDKQLPIDVGRQYYRLPKAPDPYEIDGDIANTGAKIKIADPQGNPVVTGDFPIDYSPAAQGAAWNQLGSTAGFQASLADMTANGDVSRFNYVNRDLFAPSTILRSHAAGRLFTDPQGASVGDDAPDVKLAVHRGTVLGTTLSRMKFHPSIALALLGGRWVLAKGWAPAQEPGSAAGGSSIAAAPPDLGHLLRSAAR